MAMNLLSRWRETNNVSGSIYETIRQHDEDSDTSDLENHAGMLVDERNLREDLQDIDSVHIQHLDSSPERPRVRRGGSKPEKRIHKPKWMRKGHKLEEVEEADDDVPASLLIEGNDVGLGPGSISLPAPPSLMGDVNPMGGRNTTTQAQWEHTRTRTQGPSRPTLSSQPSQPPFTSPRVPANIATADPREKAMWRWSNVINLDNFLSDVYDYYIQHGFWSIILIRTFNLITTAFVVGFSIFLTQCVNYNKISTSTKLSQVTVSRCANKMGFVPNAVLWLCTFIWICKIFQYVVDIQRLRNLHDFYLHLLDVSEDEIQSISWQEIVSRLMALRDSNPTIATNTSAKSRRYATTQSKQRMDAHDIANRLMRKDNYMIAMVNKDILDMTLPVPFLRNRQLFTKTLEWNLGWCIMDYIFNDKGQVRPLFLKDTHRRDLAEGLRRRFIFAGTANLVIAPFLIVFFLIQNFLVYFNEYQRNPAQIGTRQYNTLAQWKFREFNELWHLFERRINMSHPFAMRYINQFPKDKTIQLARLITFLSGAIVSVLGLVTVFDRENFLAFEITPGRTTIFYIGLFGSVWAIARGLLPDENMVYEPAFSMQEVIDFTHYQPAHWNGRLHTVEVKKEFESLYQMKIIIVIEEVLSMIFTPFVLWFSLPKCSERIIDFVREFTVHVDGIGYVCSFAEFKLRKPGDAQPTAGEPTVNEGNTQAQALRDDYFASKDHKLEQSYWGFMNDYARNPKADVRFAYSSSRRRLNMPPPVPGLLSPTLQTSFDHNQNAFTTTRPGSVFSPQRTTGFPAPTPNLTAQSTGSPLQSLLLDPHHQPSASGFGASQAFRARNAPASTSTAAVARSQHYPRRRRSQSHPADVAEEDETLLTNQPRQNSNDPVPTMAKYGVDASAEGELGSWKYDDERSDTTDDEDNEAQAIAQAGGAAGVLGLVRQFQRAQQAEGNRNVSGIGI